MINWIYFPKSSKTPEHLIEVIRIFEKYSRIIDSEKNDNNETRLSSNEVLSIIQKELRLIDYEVESGKRESQKIRRSVLFGPNGVEELSFEADGYNKKNKTVIEIEAGRAVINYQFLKDIFQAAMMIETDYLILGVRNSYRGRDDFNEIIKFLNAAYSTNRISFDLKGILLIGY